MAIGTAAAIIGSSVLGAGASALSASKQASAASKAADAQVQAGNQAAQVQQNIFNQTRTDFEPYRQMGLTGGNALMQLLGLDTGPTQAAVNSNTAPVTQNPLAGGMGSTGGANYDAYVNSDPNLSAEYGRVSAAGGFGVIPRSYDANGNGRLDTGEYGKWHYDTYGQREGRQLPGATPTITTQPIQQQQPAQTASPQQPSTNPLASPMSPTDQIKATPGYDFLLGETLDAVNANNAARGIRMSSANDRGRADAVSNGLLFPLYQDRKNDLFNLTNIGTGSAAQISGAGQNYAANTGNILANIGNAQAQGALNRGSAFSNGLSGIVNNIGSGVGAYGAYKGWF